MADKWEKRIKSIYYSWSDRGDKKQRVTQKAKNKTSVCSCKGPRFEI